MTTITVEEWMSGTRRIAWVLGCGAMMAVASAAWHSADEAAFVNVLQRARPSWLVVAAALQLATYAAQGGVWRVVARAAGLSLPWRAAFELSLAKLFADQAVPSAGISSSVVVARALETRRVPAAAVSAAVLVNVVSYHLAYAAALVPALWIIAQRGDLSTLIAIPALLFLLLSLALTTGIPALAGRGMDTLSVRLGRFRPLGRVIGFLSAADPALLRASRPMIPAVVYQASIVLLDAATMWTLVAASGVRAPLEGIFASFMAASLFRTMGLMPGGLGTFEAASVWTLHLAGLDLAVALSATLLFRALSFWIPMLPGYWVTRRLLGARDTEGDRLFVEAYWAADVSTLFERLRSSAGGLRTGEAEDRLRTVGPNTVRARGVLSRTSVFVRQLESPLLLLLVFAAATSAIVGEWLDAGIVVLIVAATVTIGYAREYRAEIAAAALRARLATRTTVVRGGRSEGVPLEDVVPGDVVLLSAGSLVPADGVILAATDLYVSEAALTGESFPVQKEPGRVHAHAELGERTNCVFLGSNVRSGSASCLVVATGRRTIFGGIAQRLVTRPPETDFDRGIRRFGYLLTRAMLTMVVVVFVAHVFRGRPPAETLLFAVALAVGLSPELLPAILSVNLSRGAQMMARRGVLVRRLNAIENLGSMDVLCTDKTGTITEGVVELEGAYDVAGHRSEDVLRWGAWNAALETGIASPLDAAIVKACPIDADTLNKRGEIPFDFVRKRVAIVLQDAGGIRLVTKGAFAEVLAACATVAGGASLDVGQRDRLEQQYESWTSRGIRVLAVATRTAADQDAYSREDEHDLTFAGFLTFTDRPKEGVAETIRDLAALGVTVKIITGDSRLVTAWVATSVGLRADRMLSGRELDELNDEALWAAAEDTDLFVEVDPNQKERIIRSLRARGHVVGFLGDGVNDAPAMHAADTSLSVDQAVDVAREAADFVLLERDLAIIRHGVEEGRRTFANTLKYILMTTSANLGNMVSMALASLTLPFLPLTAGQILLNNFLSDVPAIGIADDDVDRELVERPERWNIRFIGRYMLEFGALSSVFDVITFGLLLGPFHADPRTFQTGWFVESLLTELVVALVVRTRRPFYQSRPGTLLLASTLVLMGVACATPYLPVAAVFGFTPLPGSLLAAVVLVTVAYVAATEVQKRIFYKRPAVASGAAVAVGP